MARCPICGIPYSDPSPDCPRDDYHPEPPPETVVTISACSDCGKRYDNPENDCREVGWDVGVDDDDNPYEERQFLCSCGGIVFITITSKT